MFRYGLTIFLSAFLLFQIQPMIARLILPWFGGTAAVWTTCMMFFQVVLLLGYLYVHGMRSFFSPRAVWAVHMVVVLLAAFCVNVIPPESFRPVGNENLTIAIVQVLAVSIGIPFFVLSTTGPLIQTWQTRSHSGQSPYRLYALSNLGSMLALLTYPFLVERFFPLAVQARFWTFGFYVFALWCCWSGWQTIRWNQWSDVTPNLFSHENGDAKRQPPRIGLRMVWMVLASGASVVFLATTNLMCQEVASVPFLWILPLVLYLLSFIICFERPSLYRRRVFIPLLVLGAFVSIAILHLNVLAGLSLQIAGLSIVCFAATMVCHGELERRKPNAEFLTSFYLWIAIGGALGGVFVSVVAPNWFTGFYEFHVGLLICLGVALVAIYKTVKKDPAERPRTVSVGGLGVAVFLALAFVGGSLMYFLDSSNQDGLVFRGRNEYGLTAVVDKAGYRQFINGRIEHGGQSRTAGKEMDSVRYYVPGSGVAVAFEAYRESHEGSIKIGVLGLGAGAMATWMEPGDQMVFYEINPMVKDIAENYFSFLDDSKGSTEVVLGDGRMQLQDHLERLGSQKFDLLVMDAFSSDSIPVHLLTQECFDLYWKHLKPEGILLAHITNRFIDLRPVIYYQAQNDGRQTAPILIDFCSEDGCDETRWVMLTRNQAVINSAAVQSARCKWPEGMKPIGWTDDFASMVPLLDWSARVNWKQLRRQREDKVSDTNPLPRKLSQ